MQTRECSVQLVGDRLLLTLVDICGKGDREDSDHCRCSSHLRVEVNGVGCACCAHDRAEACPAPVAEATECGNNTNTYGDDAQEHEREGHCSRSLVRCVVSMQLLVLCTPEDAVVEAEHVERCHSGYACHPPAAERQEMRNVMCVIGMYLRRPPIADISLE